MRVNNNITELGIRTFAWRSSTGVRGIGVDPLGAAPGGREPKSPKGTDWTEREAVKPRVSNELLNRARWGNV